MTKRNAHRSGAARCARSAVLLVLSTVASFAVAAQTISVKIDIKPDDSQNSINPKSKGKVQVAVLGSAAFDVRSINPKTVTFAGAVPLSNGTKPEDVDHDQFADVVFTFETQELKLSLSDTVACLTGKTLDGQAFEGCDGVRIVGRGAKPDLPIDWTNLFVETEVKESTLDRYRATVVVPGVAGQPVTVDGTTYHRLRFVEAAYTGETGKPEMPAIVKNFVLPRSTKTGKPPRPVIRVKAGEPRKTEGILVFPVQPPRPLQKLQDQTNPKLPTFAIDPKTYDSDQAYPAQLYDSEQFSAGPLEILAVRIYPARFVPKQRQLEVYRRIDLELNLNPENEPLEAPVCHVEVDASGKRISDDLPPIWPRPENPKGIWELTFRGPTVPPFLTDRYDDPVYHILIVTDPLFLNEAKRLAWHKRDLGWRVKIATTTEIRGQNTDTPLSSEMLRSYLIEEFMNNALLGTVLSGREGGFGHDFESGRIYLKRRGVNQVWGLDLAFWDEPVSETVVAYLSTDDVPGAELMLESHPPYSSFEVWDNSESYHSVLVYSGVPMVGPKSIAFEFPWDVVLGARDFDFWFYVVASDGSLLDRMPLEMGSVVHVSPWIIERSMETFRYLILMGDAEFIPVNYSLALNQDMDEFAPGIVTVVPVGTDWYYSDLGGYPDPEIAVGRLPVEDAEQAQTVVDKIIDYETRRPPDAYLRDAAVVGVFEDDPTGADTFVTIREPVTWLSGTNRIVGSSNLKTQVESVRLDQPWQDRYVAMLAGVEMTDWLKVTGVTDIGDDTSEVQVDATNAEGFDLIGPAMAGTLDGRADRDFIDTTERVRDFLVGQDFLVPRIYLADPLTRPFKFSDGRDLPWEIAWPAYDWSVDTTPDVTLVFKLFATSLVLYRDHGSPYGWAGFGLLEVGTLPEPPVPFTGVYPIVLSVACSTAFFDNETDFIVHADGTIEYTDDFSRTRFGEAMVRRKGGGVAFIGATRHSGEADATFTDGLIQGLHPRYLRPPLPPGAVPGPYFSHLGDVLNYAKWYFDGIVGSTPKLVRYYKENYHLLGDPSLRLWRLQGP